MAYFNKDNRSGGNRNFGKSRFNSDRPELHQAICATCGKSCEVPFKPNGSKPVFCRDCFKNNEGSESRGLENRNGREMHDAVCTKCGANCKIPFRPSAGRDVLCSRCFENNNPVDTRSSERRTFDKPSYNRDDNQQRPVAVPNYTAQFEAINAKMDQILDILNSAMTAAPVEEPVTDEIVAEIKEEAKETVVKKPKATKVIKTKKTTSAKKK